MWSEMSSFRRGKMANIAHPGPCGKLDIVQNLFDMITIVINPFINKVNHLNLAHLGMKAGPG
jgi:hypothetical protein